MKILKILLLFGVLAATAIAASRCPFFDVKDRCLDRGGSWNETLLCCEGIDGSCPGGCAAVHSCIVTGEYLAEIDGEGTAFLVVLDAGEDAVLTLPQEIREIRCSWRCEGKRLVVERADGPRATLRYDPSRTGDASPLPALVVEEVDSGFGVPAGLAFRRRDH